MNFKEKAEQLLTEWRMCSTAQPKQNTIDIQLDKESCYKWAHQLQTMLMWGSDSEIAEAYYQFESRLKSYQQKVIIEILHHGSI
jgi:hypothetical protein